MPENSGDYVYLTDESPKDKPWDIHRSYADTVRDLYIEAGLDRYAERMGTCSRLLEFGKTTDDTGEKSLKLKAAKFCRVRFCPVCQWRRSDKWRARFFQVLPAITEAYPTHRWVFLTLTVRNCDLTDLRSTVSHMNKSFVRLSQLAKFPGVGWVKSLEVTRNSETGQAHPHFHVLMLVPGGYFGGKSYIKQAEWQQMWQRSLRSEYLPIVNVKAVKTLLEGQDANSVDKAKVIAKGVCETLKYSVKESDLAEDPNWLAELTKQLHKTKAIALGGVIKQLMREESDDDDLVNIDESNSSDGDDGFSLHYEWRENRQRYTKK
jgi:plasmid rolling circle replication initiator protein Rep